MTHIINIIQKTQSEQTMTSLEIAELTGKQHNHLMRDIRNMEPAWEKVQGSKFGLSSRTYQLPNGGTKEVPCYVLTKTECLYIATKFNDEARAKLVLRWEELEMADGRRQMADGRWKKDEVRCLPSPQKILALADEIIGEGLRLVNADAEDTQRRAGGLGHPVSQGWSLEHRRGTGRSRIYRLAHACILFTEGREEDSHVHDVDHGGTALLELETGIPQFLV